MCCKTPCAVARCNGCPATNWNAFSWKLYTPASVTFMPWGTLQRRFYDANRVMRYPGVCPCVWLSYEGEEARDTSGVYNASSLWFPMASSWVLNRQLVGSVWTWKLYCYRYSWNWAYYEGLYGAGPYNGWHWSADGPGVYVGCQDGIGDLAGGYPGYGYGWGGYGYGYGFDPYYWSIGIGFATEYILDGSFVCKDGTNRFVRDDSAYAGVIGYVPDSWPAFADISRVALMRRVPTT